MGVAGVSLISGLWLFLLNAKDETKKVWFDTIRPTSNWPQARPSRRLQPASVAVGAGGRPTSVAPARSTARLSESRHHGWRVGPHRGCAVPELNAQKILKGTRKTCAFDLFNLMLRGRAKAELLLLQRTLPV